MSMMRRHVREKHDVGKQWKCQLCDKSFVDRQDLKRHAVTHLSKTARDEIVAKASSITPKDNGDSMAERPESLASNSTESKVQETPQSLVELYICDVCGKTYNKQYSLSLHRQTKHTEGDDFKCDQCERGFPTALTLKEHKKNHKWQDPMPCDRCGKILKSRSGLRKHIQVIHEGKNKEVNFKCLKCKKGFYKERHFLCHVTVCCPKQGGYHFIPAEQS